MTKSHTIDYYMDGHIAIAYCKICSAEGEKLIEACSGLICEKISEEEADFAKSLLTNNHEGLNRRYWNKGMVP